MIICVTGWFPVYKDGHPTGDKEFLVSHGIDTETDKLVILPCQPPNQLGAKFNIELGEWYLP